MPVTFQSIPLSRASSAPLPVEYEKPLWRQTMKIALRQFQEMQSETPSPNLSRASTPVHSESDFYYFNEWIEDAIKNLDLSILTEIPFEYFGKYLESVKELSNDYAMLEEILEGVFLPKETSENQYLRQLFANTSLTLPLKGRLIKEGWNRQELSVLDSSKSTKEFQEKLACQVMERRHFLFFSLLPQEALDSIQNEVRNRREIYEDMAEYMSPN